MRELTQPFEPERSTPAFDRVHGAKQCVQLIALQFAIVRPQQDVIDRLRMFGNLVAEGRPQQRNIDRHGR